MIRTAVVLLALATLCTPLAAQRDSLLRPGDRVRVSVPQAYNDPVVGTVAGTLPGMLMVARTRQGAADTVNLPLALIRTVEVSRGHLPRGQGIRRGMLRGLAAGVTVGALLGGIQALGVDEWEGAGTSEFGESVRKAAQFGAIGVVVGGLVGMRERERWERVVLPVDQRAFEQRHGTPAR
jgi:MFS family permease